MESYMKRLQISIRGLVISLIGLLCLTIAITFLTPLEQTLGGNLRLIYLHGAWVWTGIITFCAAGIFGLIALLLRSQSLHAWSRATGWTGLCFWVTYLPMSLAVMQINWNGLFFAEPRWKVPFTFAVIGILLQAGLLFINTSWITSLANISFASTLLFNLIRMDSVLHPDSPVFSSDSSDIKLIFILLLISTIIMSGVLSYLWIRYFPQKASVPAEKEK
jgi:hypothetical protein